MPILNMTLIVCAWCGTDRNVFVCSGCYKKTCHECQVQCLEDGTCKHEAYVAPTQQSWSLDD